MGVSRNGAGGGGVVTYGPNLGELKHENEKYKMLTSSRDSMMKFLLEK